MKWKQQTDSSRVKGEFWVEVTEDESFSKDGEGTTSVSWDVCKDEPILIT